MSLVSSVVALPPDVRRVSDLPRAGRGESIGLRPIWRAEPVGKREDLDLEGKAQPFHTSGGRAATRYARTGRMRRIQL
jgi:hypothetical protein